MLSDETLEKVIEIIVRRIEEGNTYTLQQIGKSLNKIGTLTPSKAHDITQVLQYGGDYDKIVKKLSQITSKNVKDIKKIFNEVAKKDLNFAKQFYEYKNKSFIPYEQNIALKKQVEALSNIMINDYLTKTKSIGFSVRDLNGNLIFKDLKSTYKDTIDKAIISISQGKTTFQQEMYQIIKDLGTSGLKTIDYVNNKHIRFDSAVRMMMKDGIRQLHNETQMVIGQEFDSDGVEISVHLNPADDHADVQGKQFSNEEFEKFQNDIDSYSYDGTFFPADFEGHDRRSISEYNCYHYIFAIVLGVNKPQYSNQQLKEIKRSNDKGFDFEGKHYTMYEGTQLQRKLETEIRKQKDIQIMAKAEEQEDLIRESQKRISTLTKKYKRLSEASGIPTKMKRMRVSGYKRTRV